LSTAQHVIDGQVREGRGAPMRILAPAWGRHLLDLPGASAADIDDAIGAARRTFDEGVWRRVPQAERSACLASAGRALLARQDELARLIVFDNGKTFAEAQIDVRAAAGAFQQAAQWALLPVEEDRGTERQVVKRVRREPVGVVAGITPFNAPVSFCTQKAAPALAAGNSVVLKPSERAPLLALAVCEALAEAGVPPGVVNLVHGEGPVAAALCEDARIDMISLTGGTDAGRAVLRAAAGTMKRVVLELGGKSAHIILADADLSHAIPAAAGAIFKNAGQRCLSGSRLLVAHEIADEVEARVADLANSLVQGDPFDPAVQGGALIDERAVAACEAFVAKARSEGLRVAAGGHRVESLRPGTYFRPTVLTGANRRSYAAQEELFGPVLTIIRVADADEAVDVANDSRFGLTAAVWSRDEARAADVARRVRAGYVWVNTFGAMFGDLPFGGFKLSGLGREAGREGFDHFTEAKSVMVDTTGGTTALRFA
jgi:acyl-CoA reductase-like NAD-dependent aldehyde dehydrogenase